MRPLLIAYTLLLVYGSLFPLTGWSVPEVGPLGQFLAPGRISRTDLLVNVLIYVPFGWLFVRVLAGRKWAFVLVTCAGALLSLAVESLQAFLPGRVCSIDDWVLNALGTFAGAVLPGRLSSLGWRRLFEEGPVARLGALVVAVWALGQLFPYVPSPDVSNLRAGVRPLWHVLLGSETFSPGHAVSYALAIFGLSGILSLVLRPRYRRFLFVALFFALVLFGKVPVIRQQLSLEAAVGAALGLAAFAFRSTPALAVAAIFFAVLVGELQPSASNLAETMNWIPFRSHMMHNLTGIEDILDGAWPFLGLSFFAIRSRPRRSPALAGMVVVFVVMLALEWVQQFVPGRAPDVTDAILAACFWGMPWLHPGLGRLIESPPRFR